MPDPAFAAFTLDPQGRIACWPAAAAQLLGLPADAVSGRDVRDVLGTRPGQRDLTSQALAEVAAGRPWSGTLTIGATDGDQVAVRCDPLAGPDSGSLVTAQRVWPRPGPGWLSDAAARIGTTLDLATTAREVSEAAVPRFADAVAVYVPERLLAAGEAAWPRAGHATVRRLAARVAGQAPPAAGAGPPGGEAIVLHDDSPPFQAMARPGPVLSDRLDPATALQAARLAGDRDLASGYTSFLAMPLIARGAIVGCVTFGRGPGRPALGPADVAAAGELASRAALCIDNARLYETERRTARALQYGLLPARPEVLPGLQVAHHYLPAGDNLVGGDWHDVIALPRGRAALIVGDAMGHGPEAAAVMVQLRTAAHTLAGLDLPAAEVLHRLDTLAAGLAAAPFAATCVCAIIDPAARSCEITQAGHHPPVLVLPGGATQVLDLPPGLPLGLGTGAFQATQVSLPPAATLVLYTDGLVESRTRPLEDGMAALRDQLSSALTPAQVPLGTACATVTQELGHHSDDDITLVLARIRQ